MSRSRTAVVALLVLVVAACGAGGDRAGGGEPDRGVVARLVDGDTLDLELAGGAVETVRLLGIDTPETVAPDRPVECHGPEASAALAALLPVGTAVRVERDTEPRDRFGRLLAYVFRADDGLFVNEALAASGDADALSIAPNGAYDDRIGEAVRSARAASAGMWGHCPRR